MTNPDRKELVKLEAERAELIAKNEAATSWGAAVGARCERIKEIDSRLAAFRRLVEAPADAGMREATYNIEAIAKVISLSYGENPEDDAPLIRMCTADNKPVRCWEVYEEQAKALFTWFNAVIAALTAPGATTKSDGGQFIHATKMPEYHYQELDMSGDHHGVTSNYSEYTPVTVRGSTSDPSSPRSEVTALASLEGDAVERVARIVEPYAEPRTGALNNDLWEKARYKARAILATGLVPNKS